MFIDVGNNKSLVGHFSNVSFFTKVPLPTLFLKKRHLCRMKPPNVTLNVAVFTLEFSPKFEKTTADRVMSQIDNIWEIF